MKDDPWQLTHFLPLIDIEDDNQLYIYSTTSQGGRDCLANLLDAYVNNGEQRPEDADKLPLVTLARDHYTHASYGKVAIPLLDIGKWVEPPDGIKPITPPASSSTLLIDSATGDSKLIEHVPTESENPDSDMDDAIPF
jgi:hypothetical protein